MDATSPFSLSYLYRKKVLELRTTKSYIFDRNITKHLANDNSYSSWQFLSSCRSKVFISKPEFSQTSLKRQNAKSNIDNSIQIIDRSGFSNWRKSRDATAVETAAPDFYALVIFPLKRAPAGLKLCNLTNPATLRSIGSSRIFQARVTIPLDMRSTYESLFPNVQRTCISLNRKFC